MIDGNKTVKICRGLSENGHFVIGNYLTSLTLTAVYHTIRTTASKDIDLSSSGRPHQVFFNLLFRLLINFFFILAWCFWWSSGDHDLLVPFLATQDWMRSLNYSIVEDWRPWMVHNQVAGYNSISFVLQFFY